MKNTDIKDKSTKQLQSEVKAIKIITGALIGILSVLIVISIYGVLAKENNAVFISLLVVGISCAGILPLQFNTLKKIKTELESRKE